MLPELSTLTFNVDKILSVLHYLSYIIFHSSPIRTYLYLWRYIYFWLITLIKPCALTVLLSPITVFPELLYLALQSHTHDSAFLLLTNIAPANILCPFFHHHLKFLLLNNIKRRECYSLYRGDVEEQTGTSKNYCRILSVTRLSYSDAVKTKQNHLLQSCDRCLLPLDGKATFEGSHVIYQLKRRAHHW